MLAAITDDPILQYGAFGLCLVLLGLMGMMLRKFWTYLDRLSGVIEDKDRQLAGQNERNAELLRQNTQAYRELISVLKDRPCLARSSLAGDA